MRAGASASIARNRDGISGASGRASFAATSARRNSFGRGRTAPSARRISRSISGRRKWVSICARAWSTRCM